MRTYDNASDGDADIIAPRDEGELAGFIMESRSAACSLRIVGGSTRLPTSVDADRLLSTHGLSGVVAYEPGELTLVARAGTPVEEIERMLATEGQKLAFEPMDHRALLGSNGVPTIGGLVSANVSGPRRLKAGACRDYLLGVRFVDGNGRIIKSGGRVMKNVTGMDLGKLLCGSYGTLGVLTEVALKTLPAAESQETLSFCGLSAREAVELFSTALATPFEVSGAAFHKATAWLRVEGLSRQVIYRRERLAALFRDHQIEIVDDENSRRLWLGLRDLHHFAGAGDAVWRILVKPTNAPEVVAALHDLGGDTSLDWGGALIWYCGSGDVPLVRGAAPHGLATLVRGTVPSPRLIFPPKTRNVADLTAALRRTFDPGGIFNPGLMGG